MKNKQLQTLDLSFCHTDNPENFNCFLQKINEFCNIRFLTLDNMTPDLNSSIESFAEALATNKMLEVLIMRENRLKWVQYCNFWTLLKPNTTLQKLSLQKTDLTDKVIEKMGTYLEQPTVALLDLDISRNGITGSGLKILCESLKANRTLKFLNLSGNKIKDEGLEVLTEYLIDNKTLQELSLSNNAISNEGIIALSKFLQHNETLNRLELSKNFFTDAGFEVFAKLIESNQGLKYLDISKNKELSDEASLVTLAEALVKNHTLEVLDVGGLKIRKPYLKLHLAPALTKNIALLKVIGKIAPNIISDELHTNGVLKKDVMKLFTPQFTF